MSTSATIGRRPAPLASVQGTLALELQPRREPPQLSGVRPGAGADVVAVDQLLRSEFETWSCRFAQAAVEIVGGDRPVHQLLRWTAPEVYDDLTRRALLVSRAGAHHPGESRVQPVRPKVVGVRTCFVETGVAEAGIHVRYGQRSRAVAARFERHCDNRWVGRFNWSSQHLDRGGVQAWRRSTGLRRRARFLKGLDASGVRIARCGRRCARLGGRSPRGRFSGSSGI